jgi:hypothetical protein
MPRDSQPLADMMLLAIKAALAPVQAELAAAKQANTDLRARLDDLSGLRDRVTAMETKSAIPAPSVDAPVPGPSLTEIELLVTKQVGSITERIVRLEERPAASVLTSDVPSVVTPSIAEIELTLTKQVGPLSERLARLEERAPIPGPPGQDGKDGAHGENGKDGVDGLGFDDLDVVYDGDRTIEVKMQRGDRVKSWPIVLPFQKQQGVFADGKTYVQGDVVTWGGSQWHCNEETSSKPGEGSKAWTLVVKRGRDGRDGKDAPSIPVVRTT